MAIPYAFLKVMRREEPYLDKSDRQPKEQAEFLMQDKNMKGEYLGACLDSCRWGSQTTIMYEMSIKGMIGFIQNWMQQNEGNFEDLWHEKQIEELYTKFELSFIHHETCPEDKKHKGVIKDLSGILRCSPCHAIISDRGRILPLEVILKRLNLRPETETVYCDRFKPCKRVDELSLEEKESYDLSGLCLGHTQPHDKIEFPFDGWDLAFYVQKWFQQLPKGKAPIFEK